MRIIRSLADRLLFASLIGIMAAVAWAVDELGAYRPAYAPSPDLGDQATLLVLSVVMAGLCSLLQIENSVATAGTVTTPESAGAEPPEPS